MSSNRAIRRSVVSAVITAALVALTLTATPAIAATGHLNPDLGPKVPGKAAASIGGQESPKSSTSTAGATSTDLGGVSAVIATPSEGAQIAPQTRATTGGVPAEVAGGWQSFSSTGIQVARANKLIEQVRTKGPISSSVAPVGSINAAILSSSEAKAYGLKGLVLSLSRSDGKDASSPVAVKIPETLLEGIYGADYASRVRWEQVGVPAKVSTTVMASKSVTPVATATTADSVLLTPQVKSSKILLVPMATPTSATGTGSFAATPLKPSSTWDVSAQTGGFSWSYDMRTPPAAAGPAPSLALQYDSQSVDGESGSTNNQPSTVGEGWEVSGGGFIERSYVGCSQDNGSSGAVTTSGDLCWKTDNATISVAGHSGQLVRDATTGVWKLQSDDGSRIEHLVGTAQGCADNGTYDLDCWRMTTTDGTQYYFGLNKLPGWSTGNATTNSAWTVPVFGNDSGEPCHASTFATSSCVQAWRWNLDYVVDTHGNAETLYYNAETNKYARNGTTVVTYTRGGSLDHIDYGLTSASLYTANAASDRVSFAYDTYGRCSDGTHANCTTEPISGSATAPAHPTSYPDVPFDELCTAGTCSGQVSPTFFTTAMLSTVTTKFLSAGAYANVDVWALSHSFPSPGDGTNAALWFTQVVHTGYSGATSLSEPATVFTGATMQNRVWAIDGLAPLDKYRITSIRSNLGGVTSINYATPDCTTSNAAAIEASPQTNTNRCFPQWWTPNTVNPQPAQEDLFNKYIVTSVVDNPETGGGNDLAQETDYVYTGTPGWRYDTSPFTPDAQRTWSVYAGYDTVEVRVGDHNTPSTQQTTDYTFYRGLDGDRAAPSGGTKSVSVTGYSGTADSLWFAGQVRDTKVLNGVGGTVLSDTVATPWASAVTANDGVKTARFVETADSLVTEPLSTGGNRTTETASTFDATYGVPLTTSTTHSDGPSTCATTTYATANTTAWIVGLPKEVATVGKACGTTPTLPADAISDTRTSYDGASWGTAATKGDVTQTQIVHSYTGSAPNWVTSAQITYDSLGRVLTATDILGHTTSTAYTPSASAAAGSGRLTQQSITNTTPFSWTSTITYNPAWGVQTSATDQNGKLTTATYDALGRTSSVWLPIHPQASNPTSPSMAYKYTLSTTAPNAIETDTLEVSGTAPSFALFDGLGRQVQTQRGSEATGSVIADTSYDMAGRVPLTNSDYWTTAVTPSATLFVPTSESQIPSEHVNQFDGAGRTTTAITYSLGVEKSRTTTAYLGADRVDTTPPSGATPTTSYTNSLGQQTSLVQYLASTVSSSATQETTTYGYSAQRQMTGMTDPVGNHWSWSFDVLGHQISATDPDTGTTTSTYDDAGNQLTSTDARGQTLSFAYDALNRKTAEFAGASPATGSILASWTFDTVTGAKGQLASSHSYVGSTPTVPGLDYAKSVTAYNASYLPTSSTVSIPTGAPALGGTSYTTADTYNVDGTVATQTEPAEGGLASELQRFTYTALGSLAGIRAGTSSILIGTGYTGIGQVALIDRAGSYETESAYGYDIATGALLGINTASSNGTSTVGTLTTLDTRNAAGGVTSQKTTSDSAATDTQCYSYDHLENVTEAWTPSSNDCSTAPSGSALGGPAPYWTSYTVDAATGNRLTATQHSTSGGADATDTYSYPAATTANVHAVQTVAHTSTPTDSYGYDADGDTTTRPGQALTYDAEGKLSTVTAGGVTQLNVYDASGTLLVQSDSTNGTTLFLGDTELHVAAGSSTASAVRTYMADGIPFAERDTQAGVSGNTLMWLLPDLQNTVIAEQNSSTGTITRRYTDPFGNTRGTAVAWSSAHGYLNAPVSSQSGLTLLGAREYDATLGRFLSVDSVLAPSNPQQNNGYSYSQNDPVTLSDPSGLLSIRPFINDTGGRSSGGNTQKEAVPAPGSGYTNVSSHFLVPSGDPQIHEMKSGFRAVKKEWGVKGKISDFQELSIWQLLCFTENPSACSSQFAAQLAPARGFMPDTAGQTILAGATGGAYFLLGKSNPLIISSETLRFAQKNYGERFSTDGSFKGQTVNEVANSLKNGSLSAADVPIDVVTRQAPIILNTRSAHALLRAGVPVQDWSFVDRTGQADYEERLDGQLGKNGISEFGFSSPASRGWGGRE